MKKAGAFFREHRDTLLVVILTVYVIVLGCGVAGELFNIMWMKKLPLFNF